MNAGQPVDTIRTLLLSNGLGGSSLGLASTADERQALDQVIEGLIARFPSADPEAIRGVAAEVHSTFDGPVRDFVPLLVQRASTDRLRTMVTAGPGGTGSVVEDGLRPRVSA